MDKRGQVQLSLEPLILIAIAVFVVLFFGKIAVSVQSDTALQQSLLSNDISLTISSLMSLPGTYSYNYNSSLNESEFNYCFAEGSLTVQNPEKNIEWLTLYPINKLIYNQLVDSDCQTSPEKITFQKTNTEIAFEENTAYTFPKIEDYTNYDNIVIDIAKDSSNPGEFNDALSLNEYEIQILIAESLITSLESSSNQVSSLRDFNSAQGSLESRYNILKQINPNAVLIIDTLTLEESEQNQINIYYNPDIKTSLNLANNIANSFILNFKNTEAYTIPLNPESLNQNNPKKILSANYPIVYLEIGNFAKEKPSIFQDYPEITNTIKNGILQN